jgi:hypothetical protein
MKDAYLDAVMEREDTRIALSNMLPELLHGLRGSIMLQLGISLGYRRLAFLFLLELPTFTYLE